MSKEQLKHIFEHSACLTPKQLKGYATGKMVHEEAHAVEVHLLSCPFCSDALDGIAEHKDKAVGNLEKMDAGFIAKHFGVAKDEVQISAKTAHKTKQTAFKSLDDASAAKSKNSIGKVWKPIAAAAGLVGIAVIMWMMKDSIFPQNEPEQLAQQAEPVATPEPVTEPEIVYRPVEEDTSTAAETIATIDTVATPALAAMQKEQQTPEQLAKKAEADKKLKEKKEADAKLAAAKTADKKTKDALAANKPTADKKVPTATKAEERPRMGNSYDAAATNSEYSSKPKEEVKEAAPAPAPEKKKIELGRARSGILKGDDAFNDGKYKKALKQYQKVMFDPESNQKDAATLMAAKCHIAMDEMMQARTLLNSLIKDNSTKKDEAQGLIRQVPKE